MAVVTTVFASTPSKRKVPLANDLACDTSSTSLSVSRRCFKFVVADMIGNLLCHPRKPVLRVSDKQHW
jgi:hypothetical protein